MEPACDRKKSRDHLLNRFEGDLSHNIGHIKGYHAGKGNGRLDGSHVG